MPQSVLRKQTGPGPGVKMRGGGRVRNWRRRSFLTAGSRDRIPLQLKDILSSSMGGGVLGV